jgi:hypothetical protein
MPAPPFHDLVHAHSYIKLNDLIPGGFSSSTWQVLRRDWQLIPPEVSSHDNLDFLTFGEYNSRVILLRSGLGMRSIPAFQPHRIEGTSLIALSGRALARFADFLATLPGDTAAAHRHSAALIPGGLTPTAILRSRQFLSS